MKTCEEYQVLISRLLDGDISENERAELLEHVRACRDCAAVYAAFRSLSEAMAEEQAPLPDGLHERIMADIRREAAPGPAQPRLERRWSVTRLVWPLAACAAVVILATVNLPRLFAAKGAAPQAGNHAPAYSMMDQAAEEAAAAESAPEAAPPEAGEPQDGSLYSASRAADSAPLLLDEEQSRPLIAALTAEAASLPDAEADDCFRVAYSDHGEPATITVWIYGQEVFYAPAGGEPCRVDCSAEELSALLPGADGHE